MIKCPACQSPLRYGIKTDKGVATHFLYCAAGGRCPSLVANNGAEGSTVEEALKELTEAIKREAVWND